MTVTAGISDETREVLEYIDNARSLPLSEVVGRKVRQCILDQLACAMAGADSFPARSAAGVVGMSGLLDEAHVIGRGHLASATDAAFYNAMAAHGSEADDAHPMSLSHPGCSIVAAALAMAERGGRGGDLLSRAVVAGYEVGTRISMAAGVENFDLRGSNRSSHALVGTFGSAVAAGVLLDFDQGQMQSTLSFAAQQAAGLTAWVVDDMMVEKAFVFGGLPARDGLLAALMVAGGMRSRRDPFGGAYSYMRVFGSRPEPAILARGLGREFEILNIDVKQFAISATAHPAVAALLDLRGSGYFNPDGVKRIDVRLPDGLAHIIDKRAAPNICMQYIAAVCIEDGECTFEAVNDSGRMQKSPQIRSLMERVVVLPSSAFQGRESEVEVLLTDGTILKRHVTSAPGTASNPMSDRDFLAKVSDLMIPVAGKERTSGLCNLVLSDLEGVTDVRESFRPFLGLRK